MSTSDGSRNHLSAHGEDHLSQLMGDRWAGQTAVSRPRFSTSNSEASQQLPQEFQGVGRGAGSTGDLDFERVIQSTGSANLRGTNTGGD